MRTHRGAARASPDDFGRPSYVSRNRDRGYSPQLGHGQSLTPLRAVLGRSVGVGTDANWAAGVSGGIRAGMVGSRHPHVRDDDAVARLSSCGLVPRCGAQPREPNALATPVTALYDRIRGFRVNVASRDTTPLTGPIV